MEFKSLPKFELSGVNKLKENPLVREILLRKEKVNLLRKSLNAFQQEVFDDNNHFVAALASRATGKSFAAAAKAYKVYYEKPKSTMAILGKTRNSVRAVFFNEVLPYFVRTFNIGGTFNRTNAYWQSNEGNCIIYCIGADSENFQDKLRGLRLDYIAIDEAGHWEISLDDLVKNVLDSTTHGRKGQICLFGTPGYVPQGYFFDITNGRKLNWSVTKTKDPFVNPYTSSDVHKQIERLQLEYGDVYTSIPSYKREILGEWVVDISKTTYKYDSDRNDVSQEDILGEPEFYIMGLDFAFTGYTAFSLNCVWENNFYTLCTRKHQAVNTDQVGGILTEYYQMHKDLVIVYDYAQKFLADAIQEKFPHLCFVPAEKMKKYQAIEAFNSDLLAKRIRVIPSACKDLVEEWQTIEWWRRPDLLPTEPKEDPKFPNDVADSVLYAWRYARHNLIRQAEPVVLTEEDKIYQRKMLQVQKSHKPLFQQRKMPNTVSWK